MSEEVERLRGALERIRAKAESNRAQERWRRTDRTDYGRGWDDGFATGLATCSLLAFEALDPEAWAESERLWRLGATATDAEWFRETGACGGCGGTPPDCSCTTCGCRELHRPEVSA